MQKHYNASQAAKAAGISRQTLYAWIATGRFVPSMGDTGKIFTPADVKVLREVEKNKGVGAGRPRKFRELPAVPQSLSDRLELYRLQNDKSYAELATLISDRLPDGQSVSLGSVRKVCVGIPVVDRTRFKIERFLDAEAPVVQVERGVVSEFAQG